MNSEAMEVAPEHIVVVRVEDIRAETVLPLDEVKAQVTSQLASVKGEQAAMELGVQLVNELKEGNTDALTENQLSFGELETIDRSSALAGTVFAMTKPAEGALTFAQAKDADGNVVVVELSKVASNADPMYNEQISAQMERAATQQDLASVLTILRKNTEIEYFIVSE